MLENSMLSREILRKFEGSNLTLSTAESCTGGLLSKYLTDAGGSSEYFKGGIVSYSNESKIRLLRVKKSTLENRGAVSGECACEMALGAQRILNTDISISVTGIAGPSGATKGKPVGLVFSHIRVRDADYPFRFLLSGDRIKIREHAVQKIMRAILGIELPYGPLIENRKTSEAHLDLSWKRPPH